MLIAFMKTIIQLLSRYSYVNWALADQALVSGVNFLTGILLARYLGLEEFGFYTLAWMIVLFFYNLQFVLIISPMISIGPQQTNNEMAIYYGAVFVQQVVFAGATSLLVLLGCYLLAYFSSQWYQITYISIHLAIAAFFFQVQMFLRYYFFTREQPIVALANDLISYLGQLILIFVFYQTQQLKDTETTLWIISGTSMLASLFGILYLGKLSWEITIFSDVIKRHWAFSKWLFLSTLFQWVSGNFFIVAAGSILGATAVGVLKASQNVMGITHIILQGLNNIIPSQASRYWVLYGRLRLEKYLKKISIYGGVLISIILVPIALFPNSLLKTFYGSDFFGYGWVLRWYVIVYVFIFLSLPFKFGLRTLEQTKPFLGAYIISGIASLILAYPMVRQFELLGVVLGLILLTLIQFIYLAIGYFRIRSVAL